MNRLDEMIAQIREYHATPKKERKRTTRGPEKNLRTRMIIKNQRNKLKSK